MRRLALIFCALAVCHGAAADCLKFKPDGGVERCESPKAPPSSRGEMCQIGIMLAHRAYLAGTFDAQLPDVPKLHYLVDFYGDQLELYHDRSLAHKAVEFLAKRMKAAGVRAPKGSPHLTYNERELLLRECGK